MLLRQLLHASPLLSSMLQNAAPCAVCGVASHDAACRQDLLQIMRLLLSGFSANACPCTLFNRGCPHLYDNHVFTPHLLACCACWL